MKIMSHFFFIFSSFFLWANPCEIPTTQMTNPVSHSLYTQNELLNETQGLSVEISSRYIVADLNTLNEKKQCRGLTEIYPDLNLFEQELSADELTNYLEQVEKFRSTPLVRVGNFKGYCVGQTLNFCELKNNIPSLVASFATSSAKWFDGRNYYAPRNIIKSKRWSSDRIYGEEDALHDQMLGGGSKNIVKFQGKWEMPNFMNFVPDQGQPGETQNGIHEIAGGNDNGGVFGAPVSLGCLRLKDYPAKFARWWTPMGAKFFIHYTPGFYQRFSHK